ncbi:MAG: hypothetical protein ABFD64_11870 [Armatimonadota bacterium]
MKRKIIFLIIAVMPFVCSMPNIGFCDQDNQIPDEATLIRAFDMGSTFAVVEMLGEQHLDNDGRYRIKLKVKKLLIPGDLSLQDVKDPIACYSGMWHPRNYPPKDVNDPKPPKPEPNELFSNLIPGHTYALFFIREFQNGFVWCFRDNYYEVSIADQQEMAKLESLAEQAYKSSTVIKFRSVKPKVDHTLPNLDDQLIQTCNRFRANISKRCSEGEAIARSDLGSRATMRSPVYSYISFDPPKIKLSRGQVLGLLGQPTQKNGFTYSWHCGLDPIPDAWKLSPTCATIDRSKQYYGALIITFDADENTHYVGYAISSMDSK